MPSVKFSHRLLADEYFVRWLIANHKDYFIKLVHIKKSSLDCRGEHNIIVEDDASKIIEESLIQEHNLRASFKGQDIPNPILKVLKDKYDQMILFAIVLATDKPFSTYLLTTQGHIDNYKKSSHFQNVKSIDVKSGAEALRVISLLWDEFCVVRQTQR